MNILKRLILVAALVIAPISQSLAIDNKEVKCLARNIYHESRGESEKGQVAVALVTINRTKHEDYPDTVCAVVYQKHQFSWTKENYKISDKESWDEALALAKKVLYTNYASKLLPNFNALHFHSAKIRPSWKVKRRPQRIGNHYFY